MTRANVIGKLSFSGILRMNRKNSLTGLMLALFSAQLLAAPLSLYQAYQKARNNEAGWRAAQADNEVQREERNKARAGLLPSVGFSSSRSRNKADIDSGSGANQANYTSAVDSLVLRQPLLRMQNYLDYRKAGVEQQLSDYQLAREEQDLAVRVAQGYFDVLLAEDRVRYSRFLEDSLRTRLDAASKSFRSGSGTKIDIGEISARLEVARASRLAAENALENARKRFSALIDEPISELQPTRSERLVKEPLLPENFAGWQELARANSPELAAAEKTVQSADLAIDKAKAGHLPTLDLVASHSRSESETTSTLSSRVNANAIGFQFNLPLFAGGYVQAESAQARAKRDKALARKQGLERELDSKLQKEFLGVQQGRQQVEALSQARQASEEALQMTKRGVEAGTRTNLDILNAEQQLFSVQVEQARTRYEAALSRFRLYATAGRLDEAALSRFDSLLADGGDVASAMPVSKMESSLPTAVPAPAVSKPETRPAPTVQVRSLAAPSPVATAPAPVAPPVAAPTPVAPPVAAPVARSAAASLENVDPRLSASLQRASLKGGFMVMVGTFSQQANALALLERLQSLGLENFSQWRDGGSVSIRVGPFATRKAALAAKQRLFAEGIDGVVATR